MVGSIHFLRDLSLDTEDYSIWGAGESPEKVWRRYFDTLAESARSGLYDIIGHPDLVKVWGRAAPIPDGDLRRYYEPAVEAFADTGVAVELSTAGWRKPVGEQYPARAVPGDAGRRRLPDRAVERRAHVRAARLRVRARASSCSSGSACARSRSSSGGERRLEPVG